MEWHAVLRNNPLASAVVRPKITQLIFIVPSLAVRDLHMGHLQNAAWYDYQISRRRPVPVPESSSLTTCLYRTMT